jgi:hypothetical protein
MLLPKMKYFIPHFFAKDPQYDLKMCGHEDNPKFHSLKVLLSKNQGDLNFVSGLLHWALFSNL